MIVMLAPLTAANVAVVLAPAVPSYSVPPVNVTTCAKSVVLVIVMRVPFCELGAATVRAAALAFVIATIPDAMVIAPSTSAAVTACVETAPVIVGLVIVGVASVELVNVPPV